uniref:PCI domain-containing protein n=1 Tax=Brugia timori TaxID=42155 RepID=A0A0R3QWE1_9BILA
LITLQAWNIYPVLNILYSLLAKSQIDEQLLAIREGRNPDDVADDFGRSALYFKLGYFSLIGLLRTHVLLGDYHQALKTVENLELDPKIGKTNEQLYHLLAICLTLQPQRIDDSIQSQLYERTGERMNHMSNGNIDEFRLAFQQGCPKFLSPTTVVYEGPNQAKEPLLRQCNAFLEEIESQIMLPILRGYLKLYTTLPTRKLASFMDVSDADYDSFVGKLLSFKMIVNELGKECMDRCEIDDSTTDLDFYVDKVQLCFFLCLQNYLIVLSCEFYSPKLFFLFSPFILQDMIIIADTKVARRIGEYFIKQIQKLQEVNRKLKELPVIPAVSS